MWPHFLVPGFWSCYEKAAGVQLTAPVHCGFGTGVQLRSRGWDRWGSCPGEWLG